jgi:hypothetical protein
LIEIEQEKKELKKNKNLATRKTGKKETACNIAHMSMPPKRRHCICAIHCTPSGDNEKKQGIEVFIFEIQQN